MSSAIGNEPHIHPRGSRRRLVYQLEKDPKAFLSILFCYRCICSVAMKVDVIRKCSISTGFIGDIDIVMVILKLVKVVCSKLLFKMREVLPKSELS